MYASICLCLYVFVYTYVSMFLCLYVCVYMSVCICLCLYVCVYISVFIAYVCVYIHSGDLYSAFSRHFYYIRGDWNYSVNTQKPPPHLYVCVYMDYVCVFIFVLLGKKHR